MISLDTVHISLRIVSHGLFAVLSTLNHADFVAHALSVPSLSSYITAIHVVDVPNGDVHTPFQLSVHCWKIVAI